MLILVPFNFGGIPSLGWRMENLAVAPGSPYGMGHAYYDTALTAPRFYDGAVWRNPFARGDHTGTQLSATISDLTATIRANRIDQLAAPGANIAMAGFTFTGLPTPTAAGQPVEYAWLIGQLQNATAGISSKPPARLVTAANQTLTGLPIIDGVQTVAGDRILCIGQTTTTQNGIYAAAAGTWARALDPDLASEITLGATWLITEGTAGAGRQYRLATVGTLTVGTTALSIVQFAAGASQTAGFGLQLITGAFSTKLPAASGLVADATGIYVDVTRIVQKTSATIGDGSALTYNVVHSLNTYDVEVQVYQAASPRAKVEVDISRLDVNTVVISFAAAPAVGAYRVTVQG